MRSHRRRISRRIDREYAGLTPEDAFARIYASRRWGTGGPYHPGQGSRDSVVVAGYVAHVGTFLAGLDPRPDVADLGCGDFSVGVRLRPWCARLVACDVVAALVARNREVYRDLAVEFRHLDLTRDPLPPADVAIVRQVLQHLSNAHIERFVVNLGKAGYRHLVVTEEVPADPGFPPNVDKPIGPGIRIGRDGPDSGVVLTAPPFDLAVTSERVLWETPGEFGVIRTTHYTLG